MRNQKKTIVLLIVMAAWLILMWKLSTANGAETLRDSMRFARKIGCWMGWSLICWTRQRCTIGVIAAGNGQSVC